MLKLALATIAVIAAAATTTISAASAPQSTIASITPTIMMKAEERFHPFTNFTAPQYAMIDGATVTLETGCASGYDKLFFSYQGSFMLESSYDPKRCTLFIWGDAPISEYIDAISTVAFYTPKEDFTPRRLTWTLGNNTFFNSLTRHFYRTYRDSRGIGWQNAVDNCVANKPLNLNATIATITSWEEHDLLGSHISEVSWFGLANMASSTDTPKWQWAAGAEKNWVAWNGNSMYEQGFPQQTKNGPAYTNWGRFEPVDQNSYPDKKYVALVPSAVENVAFWETKAVGDGIQQYICEYDEVANPMAAKELLKWTGSVVLEFSCAKFTAMSDCNNRKAFGCSWGGTACTQTKCVDHPTQGKCTADARCLWNTDGPLGRCVMSRCAAFNQQVCTLDPLCQVDARTGSCVNARCPDQKQACTCAGAEGCSWIGTSQCAYSPAVGCDMMDVIYAFDGTDQMFQPFHGYTSGFQAMTEMLGKGQYFLTGNKAGTAVDSSTPRGMRVGFIKMTHSAQVSPAGVGSSGRLTGSHEEAMEDMMALGGVTNTAPSGRLRQIGQTLEAAVKMFSDAAPAPSADPRKKVLVIITAGQLNDAAGMKSLQLDKTTPSGALYQLVNQSNVKVLGAAIRPVPLPTTSSIAAEASLSTLLGGVQNMFLPVTIKQLEQQVIFGVCSANATFGKAVMNSVGNKELCSSNYDPTSCRNTDGRCSWSFSAARCEASQCLQKCDQVSCMADPTCTWGNAGFCAEKCPSMSNLGEITCNGEQFCGWNSAIGFCESHKCINNPNEDACIADNDGCVYNASNPVKCTQRNCNTKSAGTCQSGVFTVACTWTSEAGCFVDNCKTIGRNSYTACKALPQCNWTSAGNCEMIKCAKYRSEKDCFGDYNCAWNITMSPPMCMPGPCVRYNQDAQTLDSKCKAQPLQCKFMPAAGGMSKRCEVLECGHMTRSCDCAKLDGCVWRQNTCKDARYVQCPAIDVLFVLEGTKHTLKPFQRHPNGYYGMIEQIRTWSKKAPWADIDKEGITATGFRMGLMAYGPPGNAIYLSDGEGRQQDFVHDVSKWDGQSGILTAMEDKSKSDNFGGTDAVSIRPALGLAKDLMKRNANNGRTKMVVVLGSSIITDDNEDAAGVRSAFREMEDMGVKIFTNVIRRFSYITPVDMRAAEFLRPIASDPASAHFLFTTIDNMRKTLLDEFCDPSTNTGKALHISRDRTLPCNWLDGKTECGMQGTCIWNKTAKLSCPLPGQCPNLGCVALPEALAKKYACQNCVLNSGAFSCSAGATNIVPLGLCVQSSCLNAGCDTGSCPAATCTWKAPETRCERDWCSKYGTDVQACIGDKGCVWDDFPPSSGACRQSTCWRLRNKEGCKAVEVPDGAGEREACRWEEAITPAVCEERRCDNMNFAHCTAPAQKHMCTWDISKVGARKCKHIECAYTNGEECEIDNGCFWNPYTNICAKRRPDCEISPMSDWSPCTAMCGVSWSFQARKIIRFPGGPGAQDCNTVLKGMNPASWFTKMRCEKTSFWNQTMGKSEAEWPSDCTSYCAGFASDISGCIQNSACQWRTQTGSTTPSCYARKSQGCETITTEAGCKSSDMCMWEANYKFCQPVVKQCRFTLASECTRVASCIWRTGSTVNMMASGLGSDVALFNPGQKPIFAFPTLAMSSLDALNTWLDSATVMIETGYQMGKDKLDLSLPTENVTAQFTPYNGVLTLKGLATVADYAAYMALVTFETTSTVTNPRTITWSLGNEVGKEKQLPLALYSAKSDHAYISFNKTGGVSWYGAQYMCGTKYFHGRKGYLATVTSQEENDVIASKLDAQGWLGAEDNAIGWQWVTGPDNGMLFWFGPSAEKGGVAPAGGFANWKETAEPPQPVKAASAGGNAPYLDLSTYWSSASKNDKKEFYVCEFGGNPADSKLTNKKAFPIGGSRILGVGGCVPTQCTWHVNEANCTMDSECEWNKITLACQPGCTSRQTASECSVATKCFWDSSTTPSTCQVNFCLGKGPIACESGTTKDRCYFDRSSKKCQIRSGCKRALTEASCTGDSKLAGMCSWEGSQGGCTMKPCNQVTSAKSCTESPSCKWIQPVVAGQAGQCVTSKCTFTDRSKCESSKECQWSDPYGASYVVNVEPTYPFESSNFAPEDPVAEVDGATVLITEGFHQGRDRMFIRNKDADGRATGMTNMFKIRSFESQGALVLEANRPMRAIEVYHRVRNNLGFSTTSDRPNARQFTFVLGAYAIIAPNTTKVLKSMVAPTPENRITGTIESKAAAAAKCASMKMFGAAGRLAEPALGPHVAEVLLLQLGARLGATGDKASGTWTWDSDKTQFWQITFGKGEPQALPQAQAKLTGQKYRFAAWGVSWPSTNEQAMFQNALGFWMSLPATGNKREMGYICEFDVAAMSTQNSHGWAYAGPKGCFPKPCETLTESQCIKDNGCVWPQSGSKCELDTWCSTRKTPTQCRRFANCFYDQATAMCVVQPASACRNLNPTKCANVSGCAWNKDLLPEPGAPVDDKGLGACAPTGCSIHPTKSSCDGSPLCRWYAPDDNVQGVCVARLCGYPDWKSCFSDPKCQWTGSQCQASLCFGEGQSTCTNAACTWNATRGMCLWAKCSAKLDVGSSAGFDLCMSDPDCMVSGGKCIQPACEGYKSPDKCNADKKCNWFVTKKSGTSVQLRCGAAQCTSFGDKKACGGDVNTDACRWDPVTGACRHATELEMYPTETCIKEIEPNLAWLWAMIAIILILLLAIIYRLYLAYQKGLNFFDPARKNVKFNAHSKYAAELFQVADELGVENNYEHGEGQQDEDAGEGEDYNEEEHPDL